jgi:hypothetical protein
MATRASVATAKDYEALRRIAAYLFATSHYELTYAGTNPHHRTAVTELIAYSDAAFIAHSDSKSHTGICFSLGLATGCFHARSQKQGIVTLSSTESEVHVAVEATKDVIYFRNLLQELGHRQLHPTLLHVDNQSMIALATAFSGNHKRVSHFLNRIHFMIEQVQQGTIKLTHTPGTELRADTLTKTQPSARFAQDALALLGPQRQGSSERQLTISSINPTPSLPLQDNPL